MEIIRPDLHDHQRIESYGTPTPEIFRTPVEAIIESHEKEFENSINGGINTSVFVKLKDDGSVVFKPHNGEDPGLMELKQYKRERAAYLVDRFFNFNIVPTTVIREIDGEIGSAQEFIPDAKTGCEFNGGRLLSEDTPYKLPNADRLCMLLFDYIINNFDRHGGNWLVKDDHLIAIDHGLSFGEDLNMVVLFELVITEELAEKIKNFITNTDSVRVLIELLSELLPRDSVEAFKKRLILLAEKLNIQHEIHTDI